MPGFLHGQLNKQSADFDKVADRTRSQVDRELTPQRDHKGIYLAWARPKSARQTQLVADDPTTLRQSSLSFTLPARRIAGRRRSVSPRARKARCMLYAGKSGVGRGIRQRDQSHQSVSTDQYRYRMVKEHDLEVTTFTAWRAPEDAHPVLYSIMESLSMVAFRPCHTCPSILLVILDLTNACSIAMTDSSLRREVATARCIETSKARDQGH
jgi:hypothetical protein